MKFKVLGFDVEVEMTFGLILLLFSSHYINSGQMGAFFEQSLILFLSILIHELGHALAFKKFGIMSRIQLHGMGGVCIPLTNREVRHKDSVLISLAGPFAMFVIAGVYFAVDKALALPDSALSADRRAYIIYFINVGWGIFNLLPVFPLDGGQAFRSFLKAIRLNKAEEIARFFSFGCLAIIGYLSFKSGQIFLMFLTALLAMDNYRLYDATKRVH
ncbi:MAG: site-2 protease family protein [Lentisphaerales bacterium]|nr:site-2 protease family protein [Lentisphaerales bacterium]